MLWKEPLACTRQFDGFDATTIRVAEHAAGSASGKDYDTMSMIVWNKATRKMAQISSSSYGGIKTSFFNAKFEVQ